MTEIIGKTSQQMKSSPRGAYYVWHDDNLKYPKALAKHLKRTDLTIVSQGFFGIKGKGMGLKVKIVVDHATVLRRDSGAEINYINETA